MSHPTLSVALLFALAGSSFAQQGSTRAEMECLMTASSSANAVAGDKGLFDSYHHVWTPGVRYGRFESHGLSLVFEEEGLGKQKIIVVHGGPGLPHDFFHPVLSPLSRYYTLVYFDRRADMTSRVGQAGPATVAEMADDVEALRVKLGLEKVTLLGHSFGTAILLSYGIRYPERVERLIIVSGSAVIENPLVTERRIAAALTPDEASAYSSNEGSSGVSSPCERVQKRFRALAPHYFYNPPAAEVLDHNLYVFYFDLLSRKFVVAGEPGGFDVRGLLDSIKAPTLVVAGRSDLVTPVSESEELAGGLPRARLVVLERSGHFPFVEQSYLFTEWVRQFVNDTSGALDGMAVATEKSVPGPTGKIARRER
jgi:proline iminopeptidase